MLTHERTDEQTSITLLIVRFPNSLFDFNETMNFLQRLSKTHQNFSVSYLVLRDRQREKDGHYESNLKILVRH